MKIKIVAIGKQKKSPEKELCDYYLKMCKWKIEICEIEIKNFSSIDHRRKLEAKEILKNTEGYSIIALDERGSIPNSNEFAKLIENYQDKAENICFIIGGSDGLDVIVREQSKNIISFGKMTLPHMMLRAVLCEQIYRAGTIIDGHPYSK